MSLDRRQWIGGTLAWLAQNANAFQPGRFSSNPFALGVASGDPWPDSVVLWTRLIAPELRDDVEVTWEVAEDDAMRRVVKRGRTRATQQLGHSVHVEAFGLKPARWYYYRFRAGDAESPVARTRTAPKAGARLDALKFAFASCQRYDEGFYTAYQHMAKEDVELVLFLGDYIYEYARREGGPRQHTGGEIRSLEDYRARYALYKSDPHLQEVHRLFPWINVWDDHEVCDNWAGDFPSWAHEDPNFLERRANAAQAFYEHTPLRRASVPMGSHLQVFRRFDYGDLARFHMLDTRQFRSRQGCGDGTKTCPEIYTPGRTILGGAQQQWLYAGLTKSNAQWDVLGNQVIMSWMNFEIDPKESFSMDDWNGYPETRKGLMNMLAQRGKTGTLVITGDNHEHIAVDVYLDRPQGRPLATEFVGTSISSGSDGNGTAPYLLAMSAMVQRSPQIHYRQDLRGYVVCALDREQCIADFREVEYVTRPGAGLLSGVRFRVDRSHPGAQRV